MKRIAAVVSLLALLVGACSQADDSERTDSSEAQQDAAPAPTWPTTTTLPTGSYNVMWFLDTDEEAVSAAVTAQMQDAFTGTQPDFLSVAEVAEQYGASAADQKTAGDYLSSQGVTAALDVTHRFYTAVMTTAQIKELLGVDVSAYQGSEPYPLPQIPAEVAGVVNDAYVIVLGDGSNQDAQAPSSAQRSVGWKAISSGSTTQSGTVSSSTSSSSSSTTASTTASTTLPPRERRSGTPEGCTGALDAGKSAPDIDPFMPNQLNAAYGVDALHAAGYEGQGVHMATVNTPQVQGDLEAFEACFPGTDVDWVYHPEGEPSFFEGTADLQIATWAAPQLGQFQYWSMGTIGGSEYEITSWWAENVRHMSDMLDPTQNGGHTPDVLTESVDGLCADDDPTAKTPDDVVLTNWEAAVNRTALTGMTVLFASLDGGAYNSGECPPWPNAMDAVTVVGATDLLLNTDNTIDGPEGQGVWNDTDGAGGGGAAEAPQPFFQKGIYAPNATDRLLPDVTSYGSAPGFPTYFGGDWMNTGGGTSGSTPYTAGAVALLVQASGHRIGPLNPYLYKAATENGGADYDKYFYDVVYGNNDASNVGCCNAEKGYDLASGLGSIRFDAFVEFMKDQTEDWKDDPLD